MCIIKFFWPSYVDLVLSYLYGRSYRVSSHQNISSWFNSQCGVSQGSVLGPLLFSIYINDLPNVVKDSFINLFADDTCLYASARSISRAVSTLNDDDLLCLSHWFDRNLLELNLGKTKSMVTVMLHIKAVLISA